MIGDSTFSLDNCITDFILICFMLGNDFLPSLPSLKINKGGLETILEEYCAIYRNTRDYLTNGAFINTIQLKKLFEKIAEREEADLIKVYGESHAKRPTPDTSNPKSLLEDFQNVNGKYQDKIRMGSTGYRDRFYYSYFRISPQESDFRKSVHTICQNYIDGILWTLKYYKSGCPEWNWFYRYHQSPLAADIIKHFDSLITNTTFDKTSPTKPYIQLLSVLPPESGHLLPSKLANLMTDYNSPIADLYPHEYPIDTMGKRYMWQCNPMLPPPNIKRVEKSISSFDLTKDELYHNKVGKDKMLKNS